MTKKTVPAYWPQIRRALLEDGSVARAATEFQVSERTVHRVKKHYRMGDHAPGTGLPLSPERRALAQQCLDDGWSYWQLRETYGFTHRTLVRNFPGYATPRPEAIEHATMARQLNRIGRIAA